MAFGEEHWQRNTHTVAPLRNGRGHSFSKRVRPVPDRTGLTFFIREDHMRHCFTTHPESDRSTLNVYPAEL